ncbi:MAG: peptidoglycan-binding protein [Deltaproteobacteria bacterium]|jgi:hypothetical protein|nr:peptidoglycan-binding protein [Deltaproteobacteria bacterium]
MSIKTSSGFAGIIGLVSNRNELENTLPVEPSNIKQPETRKVDTSKQGVTAKVEISKLDNHHNSDASKEDSSCASSGCIIVIIICFIIAIAYSYKMINPSLDRHSSNMNTNPYNSNTDHRLPTTPQYLSYTPQQTSQCLKQLISLNTIKIFSTTVDKYCNDVGNTYIPDCQSGTHTELNINSAMNEVYPLRVSLVKETLVCLKNNYPGMLDFLYKYYAVETQYTSEDVALLQSLLTYLGYKPGKIDGIFGKKTSRAIRQFQKDLGIYQSGLMSDPVFALLKAAISNFPQ